MAAYRSSSSPVTKGNTIHIGLTTTNTSDVPTNADSTPTVTIYASDDLSAKGNAITGVTVTAISGETGMYDISKSTSSLVAGTVYHCIVAYQISSANRRHIIDFLVA